MSRGWQKISGSQKNEVRKDLLRLATVNVGALFGVGKLVMYVKGEG